MNISIRIALPVMALGLLGIVAAGWLGWAAQAGLRDAAAAEIRAALAAERLATIRESQLLASDLALVLLNAERAPDGFREILRERAATATSAATAMRADATGQAYRPEVDRLSDELHRWRTGVERVAQGAPYQGWAVAIAADTIATGSRAVEKLAGAAAGAVARAESVRARDGGSLVQRGGISGAAAILLAALGLSAAAFRYGTRLARDMNRLPVALRAFAQDGPAGPLPGEGRGDEFGRMVGELRILAGKTRRVARSRIEMARMALSDPLTGRPNRRGLHDFLARRARRQGAGISEPLAVLNIDLDHFKTINDANGHDVGDVVLREATRRMALVIRESDILARIGGDEFVIVAEHVTTLAALEQLAERVIRQFDAPITAGERCFRLSVSIGAVLGGRGGRLPDPKRLLINADLALSHAKASGRNRWSIFTPAMARDLRARQERGVEVRHAIERGEFHVWYRPVLDVPSGRPVALDLVTRWHHPERGVLPAGAFIEAAEAHVLTETLAVPAFERAFRRLGQWQAEGLALPLLHIGMSRTVLLSPSVVDKFSWMLDSNRIDPAAMAISLSECYCSGRGVEPLLANLRRIADLGAEIIIDDFGSVDAAIGNITRLGARRIKVNIARTAGLVDDEAADPATAARMQALLTGIPGIGEKLGVCVLAKRVDTATQRDFLRARGFSRMQGDAIAPAMDEATAGAWLARLGHGLLQAPAG